MSIQIPLQYLDGVRGFRLELNTDYGTQVDLRVDAEAEGEPRLDRVLEPSEARELASVLLHYASEAERRR